MSEVKNEGLEAVAFTNAAAAAGVTLSGNGFYLDYNTELCVRSEALAGYAVRDARIDELEAVVRQRTGELTSTNRVMCSMVLEIVAVGEALGISGEDQDGGTAEFVEAIDQLRAELAAIKAQEPDCDRSVCGDFSPGPCDNPDCSARRDRVAVAPVAKQVVMPERKPVPNYKSSPLAAESAIGWNAYAREYERLNAADQEGGV
jgi:hypothetical protein